MGIDVARMAYEDSLDNGGREIKLFSKISQSAKVRQINIVGNNGVLIKNKGDKNYVDCNLTCSNHGASKDSKFQFKMFF